MIDCLRFVTKIDREQLVQVIYSQGEVECCTCCYVRWVEHCFAPGLRLPGTVTCLGRLEPSSFQ